MVRKRVVFFSILFLSIFLLRAGSVVAHTPSSMDLDYDFDTQVLTVQVSHNVGDPNSHYIIQIVIEKNSVQFTTRDYTSQSSTSGMSDTFVVPAVDGDVLRATAYCSITGQVVNSITVTEPSTTTTTTTTTTTDTTTTDTTDTTTDFGSTTSPTLPTGMDSNFVILTVGAGVAIIIIVAVVVKRR